MSALAEALVAAQADLPCTLGKDADGQIQNRTYRYLTLDKLYVVGVCSRCHFDLTGEDEERDAREARERLTESEGTEA